MFTPELILRKYMLTEIEINKMVAVAREARKNAFDFKSKHNLGAAVLTERGNLYGGCNIDAVISSQGTCAEMAAINHAIVHGEYVIKALAVIDSDFTYPCGACLQYLTQFSQVGGEEIEIVVANEKNDFKIEKLSELLPKRFISKVFGEILKGYAGKNK